MTFPPGGLSTWKPPPASEGGEYFALGSTYFDPNGGNFYDHVGSYAPLTIKDLACPTWGLGISGTMDDGTVVKTIGPPWLPLISPPTEAFNLNPTWSSLCTGLLTDPMNIHTLALFDPPIALTPGSGLVPASVTAVASPTPLPAPNHADPTTVPDKQAAPSTAAAEPADSPTDPADPPARTGDPGRDGPSPSVGMADPARPASPPGDPLATPTNKNDPPSGLGVPANGFEDPSNGQDDPLANPQLSKSDATQTAPADSKALTQPTPHQLDGSQLLTQGLGAIIYNAFGQSGPKIDNIPNEVNTISVPTAGVQKGSIGGGQVLSVNPSGVQFEGKTYSIDGPAMTFSNKVYTLVPQQDSEDNDIHNDDARIDNLLPAPPTLTIAGHNVIPNPTAMVIAGSSILPGSNAVTISETPISLDPSGILAVGSSSFLLPPQSVFTIGTEPFTAYPTGFVLDGTTISPGAAAQRIHGTMISLDRSGMLALGDTKISLPTISPTPAPVPFTLAGQTFTPNPTAFSIAGTTILAGGAAVTVGGTVISLRPSGTLVVGSSTIPLLAPQTRSPSLFNINGLSIEAESSFAVVDGVTIRPGAPGVTVDGQKVSLEAGGQTLDVGTGRFAMPTGAGNRSTGVSAFESGQSRTLDVPFVVLLLVSIGGGLILLL